jgi:hypothetical protein
MVGGPVGLQGREVIQSGVQTFAVVVRLDVVDDRGAPT